MTAGRRWRAVVVDDEPTAREVVVTFLGEDERVEVVGEAGSGAEALSRIRALVPDLVFVDIQMPDMDGFSVLEALGDEVPPGVVFVTAHDAYALRAFEVHALDYVLKPFGRPRFKAAVDRALLRLEAEGGTSPGTVSALLGRRRGSDDPPGELAREEPETAAPRPKRLAVRVGTRIVLVPIREVDWAEADGDWVRVNAGGSVHLIGSTLQALEEMLGPDGFFRIHRSVLANLERVRELHRESDGSGYLVLEGGVRLRVSRGRWEPLVRALGVEG